MEEVEAANKAAVESCHRVLALFSQHKDEVQYKNLAVETGEAVFKFRKVVSLLSNRLGHGRARKLKKPKPPSSLPRNIFLDSPNFRPVLSPQPLQIIPANFHENPLQLTQNLFDDNQSQAKIPSFKSPLQIAPSGPPQNFQFMHHQQQIQRLQFQQQQKYQAEMMMYSGRSNSGINLKFDGSSSCTPSTMSSTKSLISSLSLDCSVANLDGSSNSFHLLGVPQQSSQISQHSRKRCFGRGEEGSVKCSTSGKCHCSKRRSGSLPFFLIFDCVIIVLSVLLS